MTTTENSVLPGSAPGEKGLRTGALGLLSSIVIGVASTAPGYSLASALGLVVVAVGLFSPAIMWVSFIPMLFIAAGFYYLNKADPDCGTTFTWATKAFGPWVGWLGGWAALIAQVVVIANLSQIAGEYSFLLVGSDGLAGSTFWVTVTGVIWIVVMSWICYVGIEASARSQYVLLAAEIVALFTFAAVALFKVYTSDPAGSIRPSLNWLNPFEISSFSALVAGVLVAIFIYWGWDSTVSVNEETEDSTRTPGRAAILSTIILLAIYVVVAIAAQAFHGPEFLVENQLDVLAALGRDVLGSPFDKILILAVLTSASASTQTTILPSTRTALSMAVQGAFPKQLGNVHPKHLTPGTATIWMAVISVIWYVGLTLVSENALYDSIASIGMFIALYYGVTGLACVYFFRKQLTRSVKTFVLVGVVPLLGAIMMGFILVKSVIDLSDPANSESGDSWFGLGPPLVIAIMFIVLGVVLMFWRWFNHRAFFQRHAEIADPAVLDG
ncbi:MAG: APC family permease [Thermoleophilia bacterium]|nr:APC family permease [Thermoleophilia bacterium]